jgi:hypothetical protein
MTKSVHRTCHSGDVVQLRDVVARVAGKQWNRRTLA